MLFAKPERTSGGIPDLPLRMLSIIEGLSPAAPSPPIPLKLISSQTFETGVLNLVYGPAASVTDATYDDAKVHLPRAE